MFFPGKVITSLHSRRFGTFLLTIVALSLFILKIMTDYGVGKETPLYTEFTGVMMALPLFIAIAMTLIFHRLVFGYKSMIIMFLLWIALAYVFLTPIILGGI